MITDFNSFQFNFIVQSCFVLSLFILIAFYGGYKFMPSIPNTSVGYRVLFMLVLFLLYLLTVIVSVFLSSTPLSYDFVPATVVALFTFWGIAGISFFVLEYFSSFVKMLNQGISFSVLLASYAMSGSNFISRLNHVFSELFEYTPNSSSNLTITAKDFPFYFLIHYFSWETLENEKEKNDVVNKMKEFGISLKEVPKEDDARIIYENAWKELKDYLSQMTWTSYYVVINFAINTALVIAFIIMLLDPKTTS